MDNNDGNRIHSKTFNSHKSNIKLLVEWTKKRYRGAFEGVNVAEVKYDGSRIDGESLALIGLEIGIVHKGVSPGAGFGIDTVIFNVCTVVDCTPATQDTDCVAGEECDPESFVCAVPGTVTSPKAHSTSLGMPLILMRPLGVPFVASREIVRTRSWPPPGPGSGVVGSSLLHVITESEPIRMIGRVRTSVGSD